VPRRSITAAALPRATASRPTENGQQNPEGEDHETSGDSQVTPQRPLLASKGPRPKGNDRDRDNRYRKTLESNDHLASSVPVHKNGMPLSGRSNARATLDHK
jgi:hypothetical protein